MKRIKLKASAKSFQGSLSDIQIALEIDGAISIFKLESCKCGCTVYATEMIAGHEGLNSVKLQSGVLNTVKEITINQ